VDPPEKKPSKPLTVGRVITDFCKGLNRTFGPPGHAGMDFLGAKIAYTFILTAIIVLAAASNILTPTIAASIILTLALTTAAVSALQNYSLEVKPANDILDAWTDKIDDWIAAHKSLLIFSGTLILSVLAIVGLSAIGLFSGILTIYTIPPAVLLLALVTTTILRPKDNPFTYLWNKLLSVTLIDFDDLTLDYGDGKNLIEASPDVTKELHADKTLGHYFYSLGMKLNAFFGPFIHGGMAGIGSFDLYIVLLIGLVLLAIISPPTMFWIATGLALVTGLVTAVQNRGLEVPNAEIVLRKWARAIDRKIQSWKLKLHDKKLRNSSPQQVKKFEENLAKIEPSILDSKSIQTLDLESRPSTNVKKTETKPTIDIRTFTDQTKQAKKETQYKGNSEKLDSYSKLYADLGKKVFPETKETTLTKRMDMRGLNLFSSVPTKIKKEIKPEKVEETIQRPEWLLNRF